GGTGQESGHGQTPPYRPLDPLRHASIRDSSTWNEYATALAMVKAGKADGLTYILTEDDPFAAIDVDHCRNPNIPSFDDWVQNVLDVGHRSYNEITPSGTGYRIWGLTT